jgi:hypothetical protein
MESKSVPPRTAAIAVTLAFVVGVCAQHLFFAAKDKIDTNSCRISIQGSSTDDVNTAKIVTEGDSTACAEFLSALQSQQEQAADDQSDTDDQADAPCDPASAPQAASGAQ